MNLNKVIEGWGLPKYFQRMNMQYKFNGIGDLRLLDREGLTRLELKIATFENRSRAFNRKENRNELDLCFISVTQPEDRRRGVASYFLRKIKEYCLEEGIISINVAVANPNKLGNEGSHILPGNHLSKKELENFYKKHLVDKKLKVVLSF